MYNQNNYSPVESPKPTLVFSSSPEFIYQPPIQPVMVQEYAGIEKKSKQETIPELKGNKKNYSVLKGIIAGTTTFVALEIIKFLLN